MLNNENLKGKHFGIRTDKGGGAWCPAAQIRPSVREWLQIDLRKTTVVTAVETQGRYGAGQGIEYASAFTLEYFRPGAEKWMRYRNRTGGEIFSNPNPRNHLVSYEIPQGHRIDRQSLDLRDKTYDGIQQLDNRQDDTYENSRKVLLTGGLGQLIDGRLGSDNFLQNPYEWIGWSQESLGQPVEMTFEFDTVMNFSSIRIYCNNWFKIGRAKVFSKAKVFFALTKKNLNSQDDDYIEYEYQDVSSSESSRWINIDVINQIGKYVRIEFDFADRFLLISEIQFKYTLAKPDFLIKKVQNKPDAPKAINLTATLHPKGRVHQIAFDEFFKTSRNDHVTSFSLVDMPLEYLALIIGKRRTCIFLVTICAVCLLYLMARRRKVTTSSESEYKYSSPGGAALYTGFAAFSPADFAFKTKNSTSNTTENGPKIFTDDFLSVKIVPQTQGVRCMNNLCLVPTPLDTGAASVARSMIRSCTSDSGPRGSVGPQSYAPTTEGYFTGEDSSYEYADLDSPTKCGSDAPLLPPQLPWTHGQRKSEW
uniref:F5/8 type C domain-containing protein n=1 Tax=Romanomermis culicivorax TaxID=13658 RepID=A0A915K9W1_ROMCU